MLEEDLNELEDGIEDDFDGLDDEDEDETVSPATDVESKDEGASSNIEGGSL